MTCPSCGHENKPDAGFCTACGSPLERRALTCASCGHENEPDASFCASCGESLGGAVAAPDERYGRIPPRSISQLLEETFKLYRGNFLPFLAIALVPHVPSFLVAFAPFPIDWALALLGLLLVPIAGGATTYGVAQVCLDQAIDVGECFRRSWQRVIGLVIAFVLVALALMSSAVLSLVIVGIPLFFWLLVVWFFATEAIMIEGSDPIAALGRSRDLVRGTWWRVFGIGVVYVLIFLGLASVGFMVTFAVLSSLGEVLGTIAGSAVSALILPVMLIGRTLVYLDLRVRKEGYRTDTLASGVQAQAL